MCRLTGEAQLLCVGELLHLPAVQQRHLAALADEDVTLFTRIKTVDVIITLYPVI